MKKWLIIDDIRTLNCDIVARTAREGIKLMEEHFYEVECLCLDHDLGEALNGYDVLRELFLLEIVPDKVQLVTSNPVGRQNMEKVLLREGYSTKDGRNFEKV